ncbi:MAG: hypothetical protein PHD32_09785 [Eubacteriales bacterium]|nr:hypothetical protein [Eubacteriales bacterium]
MKKWFAVHARPGESVYAARLRRSVRVFGLFALILIPVYTLLFASRANLLTSTMSIIGNSLGHFRGLVIWGVCSAVFFLVFTGYLFVLTRFTNRRVARMLLLSCAMLVATVLVPFLPEVMPGWAALHNTLAMAAPVLMVVVMYLFVFYLQKVDRHIYKRAILFLSGVVAASAAVMFLVGISSLLEVVFSLSMCVFLFCLLVWVLRSKKVDAEDALAEAENELHHHSDGKPTAL